MKAESQSKKILSWLKTGKEINPLKALHRFGCFRLASRICDLKKDGHNIKMRLIESGGKKFASYRLDQD